MQFRIIERTDKDIENETKQLFDECKPYLDQGYGFPAAVRLVKGFSETHTFSSLAWYKRFREYAISKGYHARTRKPYMGYVSTGEKYICKARGHFHIRKQYNGKQRHYGSYESLEDAIKVRDYCIKHGWKQHSIDEYCSVLGVERCRHFRKRLNRRYR